MSRHPIELSPSPTRLELGEWDSLTCSADKKLANLSASPPVPRKASLIDSANMAGTAALGECDPRS